MPCTPAPVSSRVPQPNSTPQAHLRWQAERIAHRDALRVFLADERERLALMQPEEAPPRSAARGAAAEPDTQLPRLAAPASEDAPAALQSMPETNVASGGTGAGEPIDAPEGAPEVRPELQALKARLDAVKRRLAAPEADAGAAPAPAETDAEPARPPSARSARWERDGAEAAAAQLSQMPLEDVGEVEDAAEADAPGTGTELHVPGRDPERAVATARPASPPPRDQVPQLEPPSPRVDVQLPENPFQDRAAPHQAMGEGTPDRGAAAQLVPSRSVPDSVKSVSEVASDLDRLLAAMERSPSAGVSLPADEARQPAQLVDVAVSLQQGVVLPIVWQAALVDRAGLELVRDELQLPQHLAALRRFLLLESAQFAQAITVGVQRNHSVARRTLGVGSIAILETALASSGMVGGTRGCRGGRVSLFGLCYFAAGWEKGVRVALFLAARMMKQGKGPCASTSLPTNITSLSCSFTLQDQDPFSKYLRLAPASEGVVAGVADVPLRYHVAWPLNVILNDDILEGYEAVRRMA